MRKVSRSTLPLALFILLILDPFTQMSSGLPTTTVCSSVLFISFAQLTFNCLPDNIQPHRHRLQPGHPPYAPDDPQAEGWQDVGQLPQHALPQRTVW